MSRLAGLLCFLAAGCASVTTVRGTYPGDARMWDGLVKQPEDLLLPGRPRAAIAPHHLIDGFELAAFWRALAKAGPASIVIVIGPDHYGQGGPALTAGDHLRFETTFGPLEPDRSLVRSMGRRANLATADGAFTREHAIYAHTPFIRHFFPGARFVPVLTRWGAPPRELEALATALHEALPPDALVVASVDFSHYQPEPWATFHDESSWASIAGFEVTSLFDREVDSPESLYVVQRFAALRGATTATRVLHTNSQRKRAVLVPDSTSHQYVVFTEGPVVPERSVSLFIPGDVEGASSLGILDRWPWHAFAPFLAPEEPRLADLRGQEDRFLMGPDLLVFQAPSGERVERTEHGVRVVIAGLGLDTPPAQDPEEWVRAHRGAADCFVVLGHRGSADPARAAELLERLSAAGADVVVGRGFREEAPVAWRSGRLLAPSLGAFLAAGDTDGGGHVLGVTWTPDGVRARTLPVAVTKGRPRLDVARLADELQLPLDDGRRPKERE